jgi:hypothetical protein
MKKILAIIVSISLPLVAKAQDLGGTLLNQTATTNGGYTNASIDVIIGTVISALLGLLGVIFLVLIIYGGYIWMIARGDEAKVEKAKTTIINSTIGLVIVLAAYAITYYVLAAIIQTAIK